MARGGFFTHHKVISISTVLFHLVAFILLLLVGISLPIVKSVYLLSLQAKVSENAIATDVATQLRFGVWGVCATSVLDAPTIFTNTGQCYGPQLGYTVPTIILDLVGISQSIADAAFTLLKAVLILHLVAAGLALVSLLFCLFLASEALSIISLIFSIFTSVIASAIFAVDLALVIVAQDKIKDLSGLEFTIGFGNGIWMVLVAVIFSWLGVILLSVRTCYCCGIGRKYNEWYTEKHAGDSDDGYEAPQVRYE